MDAKDSGRTVARRLRILGRKLRRAKTPSESHRRRPQWQREPAPLKDIQFQIDAANAMGESDPDRVDLNPDR
jgi:hypothetical protein